MIIIGDCIAEMAKLEAESVHAIVTDPPYGLEFMGQQWDAPHKVDARKRRHAERDADPIKAKYIDHNVEYDRDPNRLQAWHEAWAREALRVLKPGGHLIAMSGTRTYHRMACAVEDAGFEVRDMVAWLYATGFPKSHNLQGDWAGWGTALKPMHEPAVLARKPFKGSVAGNVEAHGTGALNVDGCRIGTDGGTRGSNYAKTGLFGIGGKADIESIDAGRWPPNVAMDPEAAAVLDGQSGDCPTGDIRGGGGRRVAPGRFPQGVAEGTSHRGDTGGASRFLYVAKPSRHERNAGCAELPQGNPWTGGLEGASIPLKGSEPPKHGNQHPTVKPISLMRWLIRLVTPPGGVVLDPFLGSGTTAIAAHLEGFDWIGIERDPEYAEIAKARIAWWAEWGEAGWDAPRQSKPKDECIPLFDPDHAEKWDGS